MSDIALSKHALEQIELRGLTVDIVETVLANPDRIIKEEGDQTIYQAVVQRDGKDYLLRIFVSRTW